MINKTDDGTPILPLLNRVVFRSLKAVTLDKE